MEINSVYPGSIGELLQGKIENIDILISCPINLYTSVKLFETNNPNIKLNYPKSSNFLNNILQKWGYGSYVDYIDFSINSHIPKCKGFASSTADMCALYKCLTILFKREYDEEELSKECIKIEPTDSIVFSNMTVFDYKYGKIKEEIGPYLKFYILCFVGQKMVDTIEFNKNALEPQRDVKDLIEIIKNGIKTNNYDGIFYASTESILRNQHRVKYEIIDKIIKIKEETGGLGIIGAHSGDLLGVIYKEKEDLKKAYHTLAEHKLSYLYNSYDVCLFESLTSYSCLDNLLIKD